MKRINILGLILILLLMTTPSMSFAGEEINTAPINNIEEVDVIEDTVRTKAVQDKISEEVKEELTEVTFVDSIEELSKASNAEYGNDTFFTIDVSEEDTADLVTNEISDEVSGILSGDGNALEKQEEIVDTLEDSGFYLAEESEESKVEVTSNFAYQRLRLVAEEKTEINAYGATKAVYFEDSYLLSYDSIEATKLAYDALITDYGDEAVLIDMPMSLCDYEKGWGTSFMRMNYQKTLPANQNSSVTVAVVDTGIKKSHEIFRGRTILSGYDFVNEDGNPYDDNGHGTAVAGIIAESTPSNVRIMPVKVLNKRGGGSLFDIINGVKYAERNGADIINLSLGGCMRSSSEMQYYGKEFDGLNSLVVCAAGNDSKNMDAAGVYEFPGELSSTVCVASITGGKMRSNFSNYGKAVDFAAPGSKIQVASLKNDKSYVSEDGTSFSAPHVTAAAAIVKAGNASYNKSQIYNTLKSRSEDMGSSGRDVYFGHGCPRFDANPNRGGKLSGSGITTTVLDVEKKTYTGAYQTQSPVIISNGEYLDQGIDYYVKYQDNVNAGTARMSIVGMGKYSGEILVTFDISPKKISPKLTLSASSYTYDGKAKMPRVTVKDGNSNLVDGKDYSISYSNNVNAGTGSAKVTLKGNFSGGTMASFKIAPKKADPKVVLSQKQFVWNNTVQYPTVTVYRGGVKLPASQYTVTYSPRRKNVSIYTVRVNLKGNYTGQRTVSYKIIPRGAGIIKVTADRKSADVRWARQSAKMSYSHISGYQLQISTDAKFRNNVRTIPYRGYDNISNTVKGLAPKTKYYFRLRTYKTIGNRYNFSGWSKVKVAKTL